MASRIETIQGEVNPVLSTFAVGYRAQNFIARLVAPAIPSFTESGTVLTLGKQGHMIYNTRRALRADAVKMDRTFGNTTYRCEEHALESPLDYKELENAQKYGTDRVLKLEESTVAGVQHSLEAELEKAVADVMFSSTYYASGNYTTLTSTAKWSDVTSGVSDPYADIDTGKTAARADMGIEPNAIIFGYQAWLDFKNHPDTITRLGRILNAGVVTPEMAAQWLGIDKVFIGKAVYSSDAGVFTDIWGDNVALVYIPDDPEMQGGATPHTVIIEEEGYPSVKVYANKKTQDYEVTRKYDVVNVDTGYGYLIIDTH